MNHKEELKAITFEHIDALCKDIAQSRRLLEVRGINTEEFDNHLNECCTKWAKHYKDMDPIKLIFEGAKELVEAGMGNELIDDIMKGMGKGDD